MFRTLRSIAAAATLTLALTACSSAEDDPVAGVPAFPLDAPSVTLVNPGENPEEVRYSPGEEWDTAVAVSAGVDQHVAAPGEAEVADAPAGGNVNKTTLPLTATADEAPPRVTARRTPIPASTSWSALASTPTWTSVRTSPLPRGSA